MPQQAESHFLGNVEEAPGGINLVIWEVAGFAYTYTTQVNMIGYYYSIQ